ncbi:lactoylglutathione lyase [Pararhizobium capsulatum DSM 1112]|uniref:Lactoylglutathione lyase n=1 Tax=Pararhizobium capsulatum DSM 1112 TaxID=1121113 RepID=A0ABU0BMF5_9HYPH|nr:VOC family protein [Pararhizobium capsulatum]MDQ0318067.1 lactoylglutathione lyase [Pararhizobium capsulatum DSM 1112]
MRIGHVALWTQDIERLSSFWAETFGAKIGERYESARRQGFVSRFLSLADGPTIEIMQGPWIDAAGGMPERAGYAHIALSLGSRGAVDALAAVAARRDILVSPPRMTGDGFYEAVLTDPDGNIIEIMI